MVIDEVASTSEKPLGDKGVDIFILAYIPIFPMPRGLIMFLDAKTDLTGRSLASLVFLRDAVAFLERSLALAIVSDKTS